MDEIFVVDRIEGEYIILEDSNGEILSLKKEMFKEQPSEGDCLRKENNYFIIDKNETEKRKEKILKRMKGMWAE